MGLNGLELFQVNERTWMAMKSVGGKSYRIVRKSPKDIDNCISYGIYYESLDPGLRSLRTDLNSFEEAITYLLIELEKEEKKNRIREKKHEEQFAGSIEQSSI